MGGGGGVGFAGELINFSALVGVKRSWQRQTTMFMFEKFATNNDVCRC